jgi:hypothetical protein
LSVLKIVEAPWLRNVEFYVKDNLDVDGFICNIYISNIENLLSILFHVAKSTSFKMYPKTNKKI